MTSIKNGGNIEGKDKVKRSIHRSPSYPMFGLDDAIKKINILWEKDAKTGAPKNVSMQHLGYSKLGSGPAARTLSALKKFGLTEESGNRILLSQRALYIVIYPPTDKRHIKALKDAALGPSIYQGLFNKYHEGLPSRETIKAELLGESEFNPRQVDGFLNDFFATLDYAGLKLGEEEKENSGEEFGKEQGDSSAHHDSEGKEKKGRSIMQPQANSFPIPLKNQNLATLSFGTLPIDEEDITLLQGWIDLFKRNLTEKPIDESN